MINSTFNDGLKFTLLPPYASYIIDKRLDEYVNEQILLSRQLDLPILKHFSNLSEEGLFEMSKLSSLNHLTYFSENRALDLIKDSIKQWLANQLPQNIGKYQLSAEDITSISYIRKQSLLKFLPDYSNDLVESIALIKELDQYILKSDSSAYTTYLNIMDDKINEHIHFIEKIAETSPGVVYVYDLVEEKEIYSNGKTKEILGFGDIDIQNSSWRDLQHSDDLNATLDNLNGLDDLKDNELKILEHRIKNKTGEHIWVRNYQSVFKRNAEGKPTQIIGLALDINDVKNMEEELLTREEQLLEAQELAEIGSFYWSLTDAKSESTPQLKKILEIGNEDDISSFLEGIHPNDKKHVEAELDKALKITGEYDAEFRFIGKDQTREKILWSRGLVTYKNGKPFSMKGTVMDVTERNQMIQKLKRSEELYKQAQALTHIGNWTWDIQRNKITWTDELYKIFGLIPQSKHIQFSDLITYLHPKDKDLFLESVEQLQKTTSEKEFFPRVILKDGSEKILNVKTEVIFDEKGVACKMSGTVQDITEQKLNERELRENQNFIKKITDATPSIIAAYNIHSGKYLFVNQAFEKLLGYPASKVLEEGSEFLATLIHPDDVASIMEQNNKALALANENTSVKEANEMVVDFKYRMHNAKGEYRWFHTYGTIFDRNEKKQVEHVLNISIDITDRINAEQKVLEQENFIEHIADASPTVLYLFDTNSKAIVYINHEITPVLGYSPAEIIDMGNSVRSILFHPDDQEKIGRQLNTQTSKKAFTEYECRMQEKDKGWRCLLIREIAFKQDESGNYSQVLCAGLDITDRKKIEETLFYKTMELQQSNSSLEEFAYVASHDLKEPLRKITTFGDRLLAREKDALKEESQVYLLKIIDASKRMQRMIDDLLSISMISGEKTFEQYDLQVILNEVLQTLEYKIEENKAVINSDKLPVATIIPSQFRQLFQNLISNSLKFSRKDEIPIIDISYKYLKQAEIKQHQLNSSLKYLQLNFADNGIGFDEKYSEKIFSIFHRLHGRSEYEGTGIGLAICKKIVENHSGKIVATGNENEGASFTIFIPA
jgi:PAS domain S-box-containing protein